MASIEFIYQENSITIQSNLNDKLKDIIHKYLSKSLIERNSVFFLYSGNIINEELNLYELIGKEKKDTIKILVNPINNINDNESIKKSKYIICPICKENAKFQIIDYKINLNKCKNGHKLNKILLTEFEKTQLIDISKIICNICKENNKSSTYKNEFYRCLTCNINLCPLCKTSHDKSHNIINYEQNNYICQKHNEIYVKYCYSCKKNICLVCENEHKNHKNISYGDMIPNENENKEYLNKLRESINIFKKKIKEIINIFYKVIDNIELYYNISNDIINNYDKKYRNYEILQNIKEIKENNILNEIDKINKEININNKINNIIKIYDIIFDKNITEINILYNIKKKNKDIEKEEDKINIFGSIFVKNNINKCKIIIDKKEYNLQEKFTIKNDNIQALNIKLKGIENITNMSYMFYNCTSLSSIPDFSKLDIKNVTDISYMFNNCSSLKSLPDISKWNTNNITNMSYLFNNCSSLKSLPDISKWNTNNVTNMSGIFRNCSSLNSLPF